MNKIDAFNNVNPNLLPNHVKEKIMNVFIKLSPSEKIIFFSKLVHGNLLKQEKIDVSKKSYSKIYDKVILEVKNEFQNS